MEASPGAPEAPANPGKKIEYRKPNENLVAIPAKVMAI